MLQAGITFCLIFNERSLDFGADSVAQRDFLVQHNFATFNSRNDFLKRKFILWSFMSRHI